MCAEEGKQGSGWTVAAISTGGHVRCVEYNDIRACPTGQLAHCIVEDIISALEW